MKKFNEWIDKEELDINDELFQKHFKFQRPSDMLKTVYNTNDKKKNSNLVNLINSRLSDLKKEIENTGEEEKVIEESGRMVDIVEKILEFNDRTQRRQGLKNTSPNQMFSRLPITLAQLRAGNNSEKLKNEIRQLLYSLYRSK